MKCPRCEGAILEERNRDGITIDVCRQCRGIWLDHGELQRLISSAVADDDLYRQSHTRDRDHDDHDHHHDRDFFGKRHDHDDHKYADSRGRKKKWYQTLGDIFD